jgi:hypothetical protein
MSGVCCTFADSPDAEGVGRPFLTSPIHFSNSSTRRLAGSRKRCASSPVFFVKAPGRPVSRLVFSPLGKARGMARQVTQPFVLCRPVFPLENTGAPLGAPPGQARAVRAYLPAFSLRHRAVLFVGRSNSRNGPSVSQAPGGRLLLATRRGPGAARVRACEARPRAPHPCSTIRRL